MGSVCLLETHNFSNIVIGLGTTVPISCSTLSFLRYLLFITAIAKKLSIAKICYRKECSAFHCLYHELPPTSSSNDVQKMSTILGLP